MYGLPDPNLNLNRYAVKAQDQIHIMEFIPHAGFDYFLDAVELARLLRIVGPLPIPKILL